MKTVVILGGTGRMGSAIARDLSRLPGVTVLPAAPDRARADRLAAEWKGQGRSFRFEDRSGWGAALAGADLVIDAAAGPRPAEPELAKAALDLGAHWIGVRGVREEILAIRSLEESAAAASRTALAGLGIFPGLVEPFVNLCLKECRRVNEVLLAVALGPGADAGVGSFQELLAQVGKPVRMSIGGEATQRDFWGDRRWIEHPGDVGLRRSQNADAADLALFLERPYRSAGARLSVSLAGKGDRTLRWWLWLASKGFAKDLPSRAARLQRRGGGTAGSPGPPSSLWVVVRGVDSQSLPLERRLALQTQASLASLASLPARLAARRLLSEESTTGNFGPGARPALGLFSFEDLLASLTAENVTVRRGDVTGWKAPS